MRHEQQRRTRSQQELLEPADGVDVEVVRRLVEQENRGRANQGLGQEHATFHARGESGYVGIGWEGHPRENRLDLLLHAPAAFDLQEMMDAVQSLAQRGALVGGQADGDVMVLGQEFSPRAQTPGDLVEDGAGKSLGLDLPVDQPQERGLAHPVAAQEADPLPGLHREVDLIQDQRAAKARTNIAQRNQCQWLMLQRTAPCGKAISGLPLD